MSDALFDLKKMDPIARRATAALQALEKAIELEDRVAVEKHLLDATNSLSKLQEDLHLYDSLNKAMSRDHSDGILKGHIVTPNNTEKNLDGSDGASALGVIRPGRTNKLYREHKVF